MRIIAGEKRGKKILTPADSAVRPTSDRARESIFNVIAHQKWIATVAPLPMNARVLDLACGTGAFACEALSRGAASAVLYDNHAPSLKLATQNIAALGYQDRAKIEFADLTRLPQAKQPFDLIFCDPPYGKGLASAALSQLQAQNYLAEKTLIVAETGRDERLDIPTGLRLLDQRRIGAACVHFISG